VQIAQVGPDVRAYSNTGLALNTTYNYRVRATDGQNYSPYSNTAGGKTGGALPAAPTSLTASATSGSRINLTWADNANNEVLYKVERCAQGCSAFTEIAQTPGESTSYSDTGLTAGSTYSYRVRAWNDIGNSAYSNVAAATTTGSLAAPSALAATVRSSTLIDLAWTDNSITETAFLIERCAGSGCTTFAQIGQVGANVVGYSDATATASTTYSYRVRATTGQASSPYSNVASATTPAAAPGGLPAPTSLTAIAASSSRVDLTWQDNASNETGYRIETCATQGCTGFWQIGQVGANARTFSHTGLGPGSTYSYRVRAFNATGNSAYSNVVETSTPGPPWTPLDFTAASGPNRGQITLRWRDTAANETGFRIQRCQGSKCTGFVQIATVGANAATFVDQGLISGRVYRYRVVAYNNYGNSGYTPIVNSTAR
jgi:titin